MQVEVEVEVEVEVHLVRWREEKCPPGLPSSLHTAQEKVTVPWLACPGDR